MSRSAKKAGRESACRNIGQCRAARASPYLSGTDPPRTCRWKFASEWRLTLLSSHPNSARGLVGDEFHLPINGRCTHVHKLVVDFQKRIRSSDEARGDWVRQRHLTGASPPGPGSRGLSCDPFTDQ